jgi:4-diphosphocytidyl-2-C-methyl-D-erythritol kinase
MITSNTEPLSHLHNVPAPAKLNLFLHVTGRRADGYHLLQSVFMLIDWADTLHFDLRTDDQIVRHDETPGALPKRDLCVRAAQALKEATGCPYGVDIRLIKRLPAEAGLGGGSSDAASCLLALNRLWGLDLPRRQLAEIGLSLGADVPFFIGGRNAWVEGVGEKLTPIGLPKAEFVVLKPPTGASTQAIFGSPLLKRDTKTATIQGFAADNAAETTGSVVVCDIQSILDKAHNDLQPVASALCPDVQHGIDWLASQGLSGRMTGSGTAVFAHLPQGQQVLSAPSAWVMKTCSNLDVHPLFGWCRD